jgi:asparagine synthase (glutamine-hydrolysing)
MAVGEVRLDHPEEVARWTGIERQGLSDLELVLALIERWGVDRIPDLLGDFSFVVWDTGTHELLAARDAFGIGPLYYAEAGDFLVLSSRASIAGGNGERYNLEYIADYLVSAMDPTERSPYAGVNTLPCGSILRSKDGTLRVSQYWCAEAFEPTESADVASRTVRFRELFTEAVRTRLTGAGDTWSQLSGGLDSSSVVSVAQSVARSESHPHGLGGTITFVESLAEGDEREFVRAVVDQWGVRNEQFVDHWYWQDDGEPAPLTEAPTLNYPLYARDRRSCEIIRAAGGRVLLTGQGGDQYLSGVPYHIADLLSQGRWRDAGREVLRWAMLTRTSFWTFGFHNGLIYLFPSGLARRLQRKYEAPPEWIAPAFAKRFDLIHRHPSFAMLRVPRGRKYTGVMAMHVNHYGRYSDVTLFDQSFQLRHPFLDRPLVEFALQLPPTLRTRPLAQKWILREALRGILPDLVRARTGKGGNDGRIAWSLARERERVTELLHDPMLGDLGCVDVRRLRAAIDDVRGGRETTVGALMDTLALETWLRVRAGLWTVREAEAPGALQLA